MPRFREEHDRVRRYRHHLLQGISQRQAVRRPRHLQHRYGALRSLFVRWRHLHHQLRNGRRLRQLWLLPEQHLPKQKDDGEACGVAAQCASNFCTDGVCCEAACDGQCELCNSKGACEPVTGEPQGGRDACNGDPEVCGGTCDGQTRDACTYPSSAQSCGSSCTDGQQLPSVCDSNGACVESTPIPCGNYACGELECLTSCQSGSDCAAGFSCDGESCKPTGSKCSDDLSSSDHGRRRLHAVRAVRV